LEPVVEAGCVALLNELDILGIYYALSVYMLCNFRILYFITSTKAVSSVLSFILSVCTVQDYCKSNEPISLKLGVMIGPANRKNCVTFGGDSVRGYKFWIAFPLHSPLWNSGF